MTLEEELKRLKELIKVIFPKGISIEEEIVLREIDKLNKLSILAIRLGEEEIGCLKDLVSTLNTIREGQERSLKIPKKKEVIESREELLRIVNGNNDR